MRVIETGRLVLRTWHDEDVAPFAEMNADEEVMERRMKFRDYYDIYCILREGYSVHRGIERSLKYSRHRLSTKNIIAMLLGGQFIADDNFATLQPKYSVTKEEIREYILRKLKD